MSQRQRMKGWVAMTPGQEGRIPSCCWTESPGSSSVEEGAPGHVGVVWVPSLKW